MSALDWPPRPQPPRHPQAVRPSPPEADPSTGGRPRGLLVLALAAAIVMVLSGGVAKLATGSSVPAALSEFSASSGRTPVVWDNASLSPPSDDGPPAVLPARVVLPTVGIDAAVGTTGIGTKGELAVPDDFDRAFWFEGSAVPGEAGVSVLVGHIDNDSGPAVFYPLQRLKAGEEILIPRSDGSTARYTVSELKVFPKGRFPTEEVFGTGSGPGLRLITCIGRFDRRRQTYLDNLVVFATPAAPARADLPA